MKGSTEHWNAWGHHIAIAAAYAAAYEVTRHVTFSHWILTAGLRLSCLLLMPPRYWPALALGEALPMLEHAIACAPQFGLGWAVADAVPMIVLCMACVKPLRDRWALQGLHAPSQMARVLTATLLCAILTAIKTLLTLLTALWASPSAWPETSLPLAFGAYVLGAYLGALTLTPVLVALHERAQRSERVTVAAIWRSTLFRHSVTWALPALSGLVGLALATEDETIRCIARLAMGLPVLALAWRHGWHGAAVGGMGASIAQASTGGTLLDPAMIQAQVVLALVISAALLVRMREPSNARVVTASASRKR